MDWLATTPPAPPLIIGHRGASHAAPENTLAAFALAADEGAAGVELDVRLSADGDVVVIHDPTVDRTTNGSGRVDRLATDALQALDAGRDQPVPTLDDVFQAFGPSLLYNIELKSQKRWPDELAVAVAEVIAAYHLENQVVVSSFNPLAVRRARRHLSRSTMVAVIWQRGPRWLSHLPAVTEADHPHFSLVDPTYMAWARARGYRVHVWTVDDPAEARRLTKLGVHALITNKPAAIKAAISGPGFT